MHCNIVRLRFAANELGYDLPLDGWHVKQEHAGQQALDGPPWVY